MARMLTSENGDGRISKSRWLSPQRNKILTPRHRRLTNLCLIFREKRESRSVFKSVAIPPEKRVYVSSKSY